MGKACGTHEEEDRNIQDFGQDTWRTANI